MTSVKGLAIIALLVGGASVAVAGGLMQLVPNSAQDVYVTGDPGVATPGKRSISAPARHDTKHHFPMYLSVKSHKSSKMAPNNPK
jgi:hypothetical protein